MPENQNASTSGASGMARIMSSGAARSALSYSRRTLVFLGSCPMLFFAFAPRYTTLDQGPGVGVRACHIIFGALFVAVNAGALVPDLFSRYAHLRGRAYLLAAIVIVIATPLAYLMRRIFPI